MQTTNSVNTSIKQSLFANKRLIKSHEKELIEKSAMLLKITDKTSIEYLTLIKKLETLIVEVKGIRSSIYRNQNDLLVKEK